LDFSEEGGFVVAIAVKIHFDPGTTPQSCALGFGESIGAEVECVVWVLGCLIS
jgi:hypothetical protein